MPVAANEVAGVSVAGVGEQVAIYEEPPGVKAPRPTFTGGAADPADAPEPQAPDADGTLPRFRDMQYLKDVERGRLGYRFAKRVFDIVFSGCVIAVGLIPAAVLCAVICLDSPGGPFYGQERVGRTHRDGSLSTFRMWKFRSMRRDADRELEGLLGRNEAGGAMFKMRDDPRVTRVGRFLRKHSIDEFPQFVNVFLGQMSVVGPRPPLPREVAQYKERDLMRLAVKPGITGLWQVSGRSETGFDEMVKLDLRYIAECGPLTDLRIILLTVAEVFTGKGAM